MELKLVIGEEGSTDETEEKNSPLDLLLLKAPSDISQQCNVTNVEKVKSPPLSTLKPRLRLKKPSPLIVEQKDPKVSLHVKIQDKTSEHSGEECNSKSKEATEAPSKSKGDEELDAPIEEHIILQMPSEEVAQRLRNCLLSKDPTQTLGLKFLDPRNALFFLDDQEFKATLYDLPCIIESQKAYDNKQFNKVADICQILVIKTQEELKGEENNSDDQNVKENKADKSEVPSYTWPHGITPPLWNVRKRRFCKRPTRSTVEEIERNIIRLLEADNEAEHVWFEMSRDEVQVPAKKLKTTGLSDTETKADTTMNVEVKDESENDELIDHIDAAIEEALVRQDNQAAIREETQDNNLAGDESADSYYDSRTRSPSETFITDTFDNIQEESEDEEQRQKILDRIEIIMNEIDDLEKKLLSSQSRLCEQINPIMKNRFEEIIKRLNVSISEKKSLLDELNITIGR